MRPRDWEPAELERWILQRAEKNDYVCMLRGALGEDFRMTELQSINLLTLCQLYMDLPPSRRKL